MTVGGQHIVWDWNGTLLDDNHAVLTSVNKVCVDFGRPAMTIDEWKSSYYRPLSACYEEILDRSLGTDDWAYIDDLYHRMYRELLPSCALAADASTVLTGWQATGRSQSLLSMWFHNELLPLVTQFGLADYFARIEGISKQNAGENKADHLARHLNAQELDPAQAILIGDVVDDSDSAEHVGAQCILVTTGVMKRASLAATGRPVVDSLAEAVALIA